MNGGDIVGQVLERQGVRHVFTLCGGHISPILVSAKRLGLSIVDVRDEKSAVFAADAAARLTGVPGVAAVTAGPGLTNTITAVENAKLAESPVIVLGGATATILKGRGALQDIDQMAMMRPLVKWAAACSTVRDIGPTLEEAFKVARSGVPGPVFVELPVDLLYDEDTVRDWYEKEAGGGKGLVGQAMGLYVKQHLARTFWGGDRFKPSATLPFDTMDPARPLVRAAAAMVRKAKRPVFVVGSQTLADASIAYEVAAALKAIGAPVFLGGMARGLLGHEPDIQFRHKRSKALRAADCVVVCGFPFDFRMGYGQKINRKARIVQVNRDFGALFKNRTPTLPVHADPGRFLIALSREVSGLQGGLSSWFDTLRANEAEREAQIAEMAEQPTEYLNPLALCQRIEHHLADDSMLVVDGGDFVATASYIVKPRAPLSWLDPGVFGTLGVGGGFAVGAAACRETAEIWLIYGDGASAYSLAEIDTFVRTGKGCIMVIGTDASWAQIARDQIVLLGDDVGTVLRRTDYHIVAEGYGGKGLLLDDPAKTDEVLVEAKRLCAEGHPVVVNAMIGATKFREGSISI
jgi:acetolactate synthase-1/2/3 large subunit